MSLRLYGHHRHRITSNLDEEQFVLLSEKAEEFQYGVKKRSALLRDAAVAYLHQQPIETPLVREHRAEVLKQVTGIARNLNQLTKHLHTVRDFRAVNLEELHRYVSGLAHWLR